VNGIPSVGEKLSDLDIAGLTGCWAWEAQLISRQGIGATGLVLASLVQIARIVLDATKESEYMRVKLIRILATPGINPEEATKEPQ
jgi:hypothetical protein